MRLFDEIKLFFSPIKFIRNKRIKSLNEIEFDKELNLRAIKLYLRVLKETKSFNIMIKGKTMNDLMSEIYMSKKTFRYLAYCRLSSRNYYKVIDMLNDLSDKFNVPKYYVPMLIHSDYYISEITIHFLKELRIFSIISKELYIRGYIKHKKLQLGDIERFLIDNNVSIENFFYYFSISLTNDLTLEIRRKWYRFLESNYLNHLFI